MILVIYFLLTILPVTDVKVEDFPDDEGKAIKVEWALSVDDSIVSCYKILRSEKKEGIYISIGQVPKGCSLFTDKEVIDGKEYWYIVRTIANGDSIDSEYAGPVISRAQWFHHKRWNVLIIGIILSIAIIFFIRRAKSGEKLFIRKIAGLDRVDEAVGRATEMGKPILYILGLGSVSEVATLSALSILGRVAKKSAEYETPLLVPCYDPIVMTTAQETVKQAYSEAGRPDLYKESNIFYLTQDQFGYAAGCDGIMLREKPGAVFLQGLFYAESLILAETGFSIGAIQIAGTPASAQLPFFIAACDHTLIGEEMFAASAYLSREPLMLGSLKGEDIGKVLIIAVVLVGVVLSTIGIGIPKFAEWANTLTNWFATF